MTPESRRVRSRRCSAASRASARAEVDGQRQILRPGPLEYLVERFRYPCIAIVPAHRPLGHNPRSSLPRTRRPLCPVRWQLAKQEHTGHASPLVPAVSLGWGSGRGNFCSNRTGYSSKGRDGTPAAVQAAALVVMPGHKRSKLVCCIGGGPGLDLSIDRAPCL